MSFSLLFIHSGWTEAKSIISTFFTCVWYLWCDRRTYTWTLLNKNQTKIQETGKSHFQDLNKWTISVENFLEKKIYHGANREELTGGWTHWLMQRAGLEQKPVARIQNLQAKSQNPGNCLEDEEIRDKNIQGITQIRNAGTLLIKDTRQLVKRGRKAGLIYTFIYQLWNKFLLCFCALLEQSDI